MDFEEVTNKMIQQNEISEASQAIESEINIQPLIDQAEGFEISDEENARQALSMSLQARKLKKALEETRTKIIRPHLDFQRAVNDFAKKYTKTLEDIEDRLKGKLQIWLEAQKTFEPNFSDMALEVEDGKLTQKAEWDFAIEDFDKIPPSYLKVDEKKIKQAIKMGIREIPGIKIFEKNTVTMRVKNG